MPTNNQRKALNILKARANCTEDNGRELMLCEAFDTFTDSKQPIPNDLPSCPRDNLLRIDVTRKHNGSINLPGLIPLYVGMPVVLKEKNISTDLGITNGAAGIVEHISFKPFSKVGNRPVVDVIFIRFPGCKAQLSGLPSGVVPLIPGSASFKANIQIENTASVLQRITRHQVYVQPGFAVTGHSAQGQTLLFIITDLAVGGFGAYVAASRPRARTGLAITKEVSVNDLNSPLPVDLISETKRLEVLAHNTKIKFGFAEGSIQPVAPLKGLKHNPGERPSNGLRRSRQHSPSKLCG